MMCGRAAFRRLQSVGGVDDRVEDVGAAPGSSEDGSDRLSRDARHRACSRTSIVGRSPMPMSAISCLPAICLKKARSALRTSSICSSMAWLVSTSSAICIGSVAADTRSTSRAMSSSRTMKSLDGEAGDRRVVLVDDACIDGPLGGLRPRLGWRRQKECAIVNTQRDCISGAVFTSPISSLRRSFRNAASISAYEKFAFRPLGFGRTNTCAPSNVSRCGPSRTAPFAPKIHRYSDTPTNATISGLKRRTFARSTSTPASHSSRRQRVDSRRFTRDEVGDAEAPLRQPVVGAPVDRLGHEFRVEEQLPETVGVAREMMAGLGRTDAGIDADKQHTDAWRDAVAKGRHVRS